MTEERRSVYESRKRRSWNSFLQYLTMHKPLVSVQTCTDADAIDFFKYLDRFGKTKIHAVDCQSFGNSNPTDSTADHCRCPSKQGWWSLDTLIGRLRSAYREFLVSAADGDGVGHRNPNPNPFSSAQVVDYLKGIRTEHEMSKGVSFEPKRRNNKGKRKKKLEAPDDQVGTCVPIALTSQSIDPTELLDAVTTQSRYEDRKQQVWNSFLRYLKSEKPSLMLRNCSCADIVQFLEYLDQFGKTKVHISGCFYFGVPTSFVLCGCPFNQSWSNLDTLVERLRAVHGEHCGKDVSNPFGSLEVREYLKKVKIEQQIARGVSCKRRKQGVKNHLEPDKANSYGCNDERTGTDLPIGKKKKLIHTEVSVDTDIIEFSKIGTTMREASADEALNISSNRQSLVTQPTNEPIWRGNFSTMLENFSLFFGQGVYMSNKASLEDIKSASRLPAVLHFELLPSIDVWPPEFYHVSPSDSDVVFYFFQQKQRMVKDYNAVVDHITNHDLAMRAVVSDINVLIFSSLKLQAEHQQIEGKCYLWGLFIRKGDSLLYR